MKSKLLFSIMLILSLALVGCTDLDETVYSDVLQGSESSSAVTSGVYATLKGSHVTPYSHPNSEFVYMIQTSTDELCIPTRKGGSWYDGGCYQDMQKHAWTPDNKMFLSAWNYCFGIISTCNAELKNEKAMHRYDDRTLAEFTLLRAYAYYRLMDLFGNVPIIDEDFDGIHAPLNSSRDSVYRYIMAQLDDKKMMSLPNKKSGRMSKGVLYTLRGRMYLNSNVYLGLDDASTEYQQNLQKCITVCDSVVGYSLESNPYANFYVDNSNTKENIFTIVYVGDGATTDGNYLQMLSYNTVQGDAFGIPILSNCVNGICVNPGTSAADPNALFNLFSTDDIRRLSLLTGSQYKLDSVTGLPDLTQPLKVGADFINYAPYFTGGFVPEAYSTASLAAKRGDGARIIKYELSKNQMWEMANDWVVMRYAEVLYMKAECYIRTGNPESARPIFEQVLSSRGLNPAVTITPAIWVSKRSLSPTSLTSIIPATIDLEFMDQELRREFVFEDHRRTDMIRMGKFLGTWGLKDTPDPDDHTLLFPIPQQILDKEPNLVQNLGY